MCCILYSVRVSNELGKGNAKAARFSIKVALVTSVIIGIIFWILCLVFSDEISYLFTSSKEIAESVSRLHVLLAFSVLLNSIYPVLSGKYFILNSIDKYYLNSFWSVHCTTIILEFIFCKCMID